MHYSRWLTNLKGRDFEIPATGRGLYLTSFSSDLGACFEIGREIQCYRGVEEMTELVRLHLRDRERSKAMAIRARERCVAAHQWKHRFETILRALDILDGGDKDPWLS
jgi:spore maturation protein CgeB